MSYKNIISNFMIISISFFICFGYLLRIDRSLLFIVTFINLLTFLIINKNQNKIKIYANDIIILIMLILMIVSLIYTIDFTLSIKYIETFIMVFLMKICMQNFDKKTQKKFLDCLFIFCGVHVIITLLYDIYPTLIINLNKILLPVDEFNKNVLLKKYGCNSGICPDYAYNAFLISIFLMIGFIKLLNDKNKKIYIYILIVFGVIALMSTGKRGPLIANICAMLIVLFYKLKSNKKIMKIIFKSTICLILLIVIILNIPTTQKVIDRLLLNDGTTLLNGREIIYEKVLNNISNNYIIGSGINTTQIVTGGNDAHNVYLQIASELGIVGLIIYIVFFIFNIINTLRIKENGFIKYFSIYYQIFFLICGLTGNPLYQTAFLLMYMYNISMVNAMERK